MKQAVAHYRQSSNNGSFLLKFNNNNNNKSCEPAHWIKVIAAKLNGMSLIPRTHKMEGEVTPASYTLAFMYMLGHVHTCAYRQPQQKPINPCKSNDLVPGYICRKAMKSRKRNQSEIQTLRHRTTLPIPHPFYNFITA